MSSAAVVTAEPETSNPRERRQAAIRQLREDLEEVRRLSDRVERAAQRIGA